MIRTRPSAAILPSALARTRPLVREGLHAAVDRLPPLLRRPVAYHLGWADAAGHGIDGDGGKAIRPAITLVAAEAVGGEARQALAGAVALELVHNFSLLHDDIMDGDAERRHRPTVWAVFGTPTAIVAGDALLSLATEVLLEVGQPASGPAVAELTRATAEMILGQAEDLSFEARPRVDPGECLSMSAHKTAALLGCAGALGGLLGGGDERAVDGLRRFGRHLGLAFQAVDDLLGIWGDPAVTGKPVASDLRQHKKSLPVTHALAAGNGQSARLDRLLAAPRLDEAGLAEAVEALEAGGSREWTSRLAQDYLDQAVESLDGAGLDPAAVHDLRELALYVAGRDR
jgi:geranylgeranyl diphosphate synthase, type I